MGDVSRFLLVAIPNDVTDRLCGSCHHHRLDDETEGLYCDITAECVAESLSDEPERTPRCLEAEARAATDREIVRVVRELYQSNLVVLLAPELRALLAKEGEGTR